MCYLFFFNDTATTEIYTLSLHDALPISHHAGAAHRLRAALPPEGRPRHDPVGYEVGGEGRAPQDGLPRAPHAVGAPGVRRPGPAANLSVWLVTLPYDSTMVGSQGHAGVVTRGWADIQN